MLKPLDLFSTYRFRVEIDHIAEAYFSECSGLQIETEVFEWEEGGLNRKVRLSGRPKYTNLVLKRGVGTSELWDWFYQVLSGTPKRREITIVLHGYPGDHVLRWKVTEALPIKWTGPTLKTGANEIAIETLELIHNGLMPAT
jgi:phage tail-like protein